MLRSLLCFVEYHILAIGHLWQYHWMRIWLWLAFGAVGGVCWWIQARQGGCLFLILLAPWLGYRWFFCGDGLGAEDYGCSSGLKVNLREVSHSNCWFSLNEVGILWKTVSVFRDVAVVAKCFWAFILPVLKYYFPFWMSTATSHLLLLGCCLIVLLAELANKAVEMSAVIFGTGTKWHLCVSFSKSTVWLITLCVVFILHSMCWEDQPIELWLLTLDLLRCQGLELVSFRAFCSVLCSIVEWVAWICLC